VRNAKGAVDRALGEADLCKKTLNEAAHLAAAAEEAAKDGAKQ
jgi:hypothetical protein